MAPDAPAIKKPETKGLNFKDLWKHHPKSNKSDLDNYPCKIEDFSNQCAIRVGSALAKCGVDVSKISNRLCWYHKKSDGHVLAAEDLAKGLKKANGTIPNIGRTKFLDTMTFRTDLKGKTGIIFFKDYWMRRRVNGTRESYRNRSGDHIDLWNGKITTDFANIYRDHPEVGNPESLEGLQYWTSYGDPKAIWFWRVL